MTGLSLEMNSMYNLFFLEEALLISDYHLKYREKFYNVILLDERWLELLPGFSPHNGMPVFFFFVIVK